MWLTDDQLTPKLPPEAPITPDIFTESRGNGGTMPTVGELIEAGDCWQWQGNVNRAGYAQIKFRGVNWQAYRLVWTALVGPIEPGLDLDHLCRNRGCVNPDHLRVATRSENVGAGWRLKKGTHCKRGHPRNETNTYVSPTGHRSCRPCNALAQSRWVEANT